MTLVSYLAPFAIVAALAGTAAAAPIEVSRDNDRVVITVAGVTASGPAVIGDAYIDVPLAAGAKVESHIRLDDSTVRKIELGNASEPRIRIKLRTGTRQTQAIAGALAVTPSPGGGTQIVVHRTPAAKPATKPAPAVPAATEVAKPALEPAKPAPVAEAAPAPALVDSPTGTVEPAAPAAIPAATADAAAATVAGAALPAPAPTAPTATPLELKGGPTGIPWTSLIVLLGIAAAAGLIVMRHRSQRNLAEAPRMTMRASMSLGGKARVVLLAADDRELLVAVDAKGVRLLDSWSRGDAPEGDELPLPRATTRAGTYGDGMRARTNAGVEPSDDFDFDAPRQRTGVGIPRLATTDAALRAEAPRADRSSRIDLINNNIDRDAPANRSSTDQVSGLLRLRHAVRAEDAASAEPGQDGESPWAQHLMASLRRGGKPS